MNPFGGAQARVGSSLLNGLFRSFGVKRGRPLRSSAGWIVLLACLLPGFAGVAWRAKTQADAARARAHAEGAAVAAAVEAQLNRGVAAVEVLGGYVGHNGATLGNFQKVAADVLASHPGLASLELQPGGIISDVAPRLGNERAAGFNVLKDPARRLAVNAAMQKRIVAAAGPLRLSGGDLGVALLLPVFQRGRDGREMFWGFVGGSVGLPEAAARAGLHELAGRGYDYAFFAPASAQQPFLTISARGVVPLEDAVEQPVRVQNLELRLALQPRDGWVSWALVALDSLAVLLVCGLILWVLGNWRSQGELVAELAAANERLAHRAAELEKAEQQASSARQAAAAATAELAKTRAASDQAELANAEARALLEDVRRRAHESGRLAEGSLAKAEAKISELQAQRDHALHAAEQSSNAHQAELERLEGARKKAEQGTVVLQARLEETTRAVKTAEAGVEAMRRRLDETGQLTQGSLKQAELKTAALQERLDQAKHAARAVAQTHQAELEQAESARKKAEQTIARLEARLKESAHREEEPGTTPRVPAPPRETAALAESIPPAESENAVDLGTIVSAEDPLLDPPWDTTIPDEADELPPLDSVSVAPAIPALMPAPGRGEVKDLEPKSPKPARRKKAAASNQIDLWENLSTDAPASVQPPADRVVLPEQADPATTAALPGPVEEELADEEADEPEHSEVVAELPPPPKLERSPAAAPKPKPHAPAAAHSTPVNIGELRTILHQMLPLLVDQDPGAKECLKDNRTLFRSAFTADGYVEFEQSVKSGEFVLAVEQLRRTARRLGLSV